MAGMMKTLMDEFYALGKKDNTLGYSIGIDTAESFANNCHQMTPADTLDSVESSINDALDSDDMDDNPDGVRALKDALEIVQLYREMI